MDNQPRFWHNPCKQQVHMINLSLIESVMEQPRQSAHLPVEYTIVMHSGSLHFLNRPEFESLMKALSA